MRELDRLHQAGILTLTRQDNQTHYQANAACPIYGELQSFVRKTFGSGEQLQAALAQLSFSSRFDLAYNAAHALGLTALRRQGYSSDKRYLVFQCLVHTLDMGLAR